MSPLSPRSQFSFPLASCLPHELQTRCGAVLPRHHLRGLLSHLCVYPAAACCVCEGRGSVHGVVQSAAARRCPQHELGTEQLAGTNVLPSPGTPQGVRPCSPQLARHPWGCRSDVAMGSLPLGKHLDWEVAVKPL